MGVDFGLMAFVIKNGIQSVAAGARWYVQPALGESWIITMVGSSVVANVTVLLYDGTAEAVLAVTPKLASSCVVKVFANNTIYFGIVNTDGGAQNIGYCGVLL